MSKKSKKQNVNVKEKVIIFVGEHGEEIQIFLKIIGTIVGYMMKSAKNRPIPANNPSLPDGKPES